MSIEMGKEMVLSSLNHQFSVTFLRKKYTAEYWKGPHQNIQLGILKNLICLVVTVSILGILTFLKNKFLIYLSNSSLLQFYSYFVVFCQLFYSFLIVNLYFSYSFFYQLFNSLLMCDIILIGTKIEYNCIIDLTIQFTRCFAFYFHLNGDGKGFDLFYIFVAISTFNSRFHCIILEGFNAPF